MTEIQFISILQQTLWIMLVVSAPVLIASMVVGVGISIFQAVTQIQESTLTFVPKILVSVGVFVFALPWIVNTLLTHTAQLFGLLVQFGH